LAIVDFRAHLIKLKAALKAARAHGVPLHEDDVVELPADLQLDQEVPDTLYRTVAEIIVFLYVLKGGFRRVTRRRDNHNDIYPLYGAIQRISRINCSVTTRRGIPVRPRDPNVR